MMIRNRKIIASILLALSLIGYAANNKSTEVNNSNITKTDIVNGADSNSDNVVKSYVNDILNELCSNEYMSRAIGTDENTKAANYVKDFFQNLKIDPLIANNYFNSIDSELSAFNDGVAIDELNNVSAVIKGKDSAKAVFVTAHFDHLPGLTGAIDNASGTSVMLEIAHILKEKTKNNPLDTDVVFVAFNAEEEGLVGSCDFLKKYSNLYSEYYNINIDCVGYNECLDLAMGNKNELSKTLYDAFINKLNTTDVKYNGNIYASNNGVVRGTSDHQVFIMYGHPALVLGSDNLFDIVHTPQDTLDKIDVEYLNTLSKVVSEFIIENSGKKF